MQVGSDGAIRRYDEGLVGRREEDLFLLISFEYLQISAKRQA